MAKHMLRIAGSDRTGKGEPLVVFKCDKCPKHISLTSDTLYLLLVKGDRRLVYMTNEGREQVKRWSVCTGI